MRIDGYRLRVALESKMAKQFSKWVELGLEREKMKSATLKHTLGKATLPTDIIFPEAGRGRF